ncbi:MAG: hypothetical protein FWF29_12680, partial [Treponema sp.]|nr:hypothetical protein [Treponema sp.]
RERTHSSLSYNENFVDVEPGFIARIRQTPSFFAGPGSGKEGRRLPYPGNKPRLNINKIFVIRQRRVRSFPDNQT